MESRYERQIKLDNWGEEGQKAVRASKVLVAGVGGLGSPVSLYLAAAGVGSLLLWDYDTISVSNLNRQILYTEEDTGKIKSNTAAERIRAFNPEICVEHINRALSGESLSSNAGDVDLIVDCLDSMKTRFILNTFAVEQSIPLVHGGIYATGGQVTVVPSGGKPCLECLFSGMDDQKEVPVLGAAAGIIGSMQALEALKVLSGYGSPLTGRLLICDGFSPMYQHIDIEANPTCPVCGSP